MDNKRDSLSDFVSEPAHYNDIPLFYKKLERYADDMGAAMDVDNLNMAPSDYFQTSKISVGFFFKKAANIAWDDACMIVKQAQ
jgi:hypothetical protein